MLISAVASKNQWDVGDTNLEEREATLKNEIQERELDWHSKREGMAHVVTEDEVAQIVQSWTGIPVSRLVEAETQKLLRMEDELHRRIIG